MTSSASVGLSDLDGTSFDVVVIGAGINGASTAQCLAGAGYRVLLADKGDLASGSSGRSTRVLHCGLRYFETPRPVRDFALHPVRGLEALSMARSAMRTRARLCRDAPSRLKPFRMFFPIDARGPYRPWQVDLALRVLGWLDDLKEPLAYQRLSKAEAEALPLVRDLASLDSLDSVAAFTEYMFDWPERFVIDMALDAARLGAQLCTYTEATLTGHDATGWQLQLRDCASERLPVTIRAKRVVNMAGIWIDRVNATAGAAKRLILGTKGAHLAVRLPPEYAGYGISALNSQMEPHYVVPGRAGLHHIGPTETVYEGDIDDIRASAHDVDFLLAETERLLPGLGLNRSHVVFTWAGVRPLTFDAQAPKGKRTRELHHVSVPGAPPLLAMTAGPIMGHRSAGEAVLAAIRDELAPSGVGGEMRFSPRRFDEDQNSPRVVGPDDPTTYADLVDGIRSEHARSLADLLLRRSGLVWTGLITDSVVNRSADAIASEFGWSEHERADAVRNFLAEYERRYGVPANARGTQSAD